VTVYLEEMIGDLVTSIEKFSESTRNGTMEAAGEKINMARWTAKQIANKHRGPR
jgi:hypothetical protein